MKFFKYVFASALGSVLAGVVLLIILFGFILGSITAALDDFSAERITSVSSNSVLTLTLENEIVERSKKDELEIPGFIKNKTGLNEILENISKAKEDDKIVGIYLNAGNISAGIASVEAIRKALIDFKESGKWILAYSEYYSQSAYYLASCADELYLNPEGMIFFQGISAKPMFMKDMFDKLGIEMQVIRGKDNKFKSAVEPYMYNEMSEENRAQTTTLIFSLWDHIVNEIAAARGISIENVNRIADELIGLFPQDALEEDLIDGLKYHDEIEGILAEKLSEDLLDVDRLVDLKIYKHSKVRKTKSSDFRKKKVAVIYAVGDMMSGEGDEETMGSDRIAEAIRDARLDTAVKAIVLRVNSPGGSALAADVIWRETMLASNLKPLVVSMGDYAASGGYYISANADRIFAEVNTITGSIGAFGVMPNVKGLLNDKMGIYFDGVKTNEHSDWMDISKPLSPKEFEIRQRGIDQVYEAFTSKVAEGRNLRQSFVDSIGQGRVWTGDDAIDIGLVDEIGGLEDAIVYAADLAGLEDYRIQELPFQKSPLEELFNDLGMTASQKAMENALVNYQLLKQFKYIQSILRMEGVQTVLPIRIAL
jgi:protease-4